MKVYGKKGGGKRLGEETSLDKGPKKVSPLEFSGKQTIFQQTLDQLVTTFVVEGQHAFSSFEENALKDVVEYLVPSRKTLSQRMLADRLDARFEDMKQKLSLKMISVDQVAVSANFWSSFPKYVLFHSVILLDRGCAVYNIFFFQIIRLLQEPHWRSCLVVQYTQPWEKISCAHFPECNQLREVQHPVQSTFCGYRQWVELCKCIQVNILKLIAWYKKGILFLT